MTYLVAWHIHVTCVVLSGAGFLARGAWMLAGADWRRHRLARVLPHIVDTLLLASAIVLALTLRSYPLTHDWLTAKVLGLLLYIGLGLVAFRFGRNRGVQVSSWLAALAVFAWIVSVARTHQPAGFLPV